MGFIKGRNGIKETITKKNLLPNATHRLIATGRIEISTTMNQPDNGTKVHLTNEDAVLIYAALNLFIERTEEDRFHFAEVIQHDHRNTDNYLDCVCDGVKAEALKQNIALIFGIKDSPEQGQGR